jgi:ribosome-binding protein aMBF1 (putative translation factor)
VNPDTKEPLMSLIAPSWTLGECIRKARRHAGMKNQADLAAAIHVDTSLVSKWESGTREPKLSQIAEIERVCGVPEKWILTNATLVLPPSAWFTGDDEPDAALMLVAA